MFKYCVWYVLKETHIIHKQIKRYAQIFNTEPFLAHITINHSLEKEEAIKIYLKHKHKRKEFIVVGTPHMTRCVKNNRAFYAIEQPLNSDGVHISLVYRMDNGFHPLEMAIVSQINNIGMDDVEVCLVDCSSEHPKEWKILSI